MSQWAIIIINMKPRYLLDPKNRPCTHTPEDVPITKIHITRFPTDVQIKRKDLFQTFGRFGRILDCFIKYSPDPPPGVPLFAFITYDNVNSALEARVHPMKIFGQKLKVSPADSWHQPKPLYECLMFYKPNRGGLFSNRNTSVINMNENEEIQDKNNILNVLNEDCFMKIFTYLPLHELIQSERVSRQWKFFVYEKYKSILEFKTSSWESSLKLKTNTLHSLLKKFGIYLRKLHLDNESSSYDKRTPYIIGKFCPNLTLLSVVKLESKNWVNIMENCKQLKSLSFRSCLGVNDKMFKYCKSNLEELVIDQALYPLGNLLTNLNVSSLRKLELAAMRIRENQLIKSIPYLRNLKELSFDKTAISEVFLHNVLKSLPNLESLSLSIMNSVQGLEPVADLKNLKTLVLKSNMAVNDALIKLICKGCKNLTHLNISTIFHDEQNITDSSIYSIWTLKDLESLNISGLMVTDAPFKELGVKGKGSKLKTLICRDVDLISEDTVYHIFTSCPSIKHIDLFKCLKINPDIIDKIISIIHANESQCQPGRYSLNLACKNLKKISSCTCLKVNYEILGDILYISSYNGFNGFEDADLNDYESSDDSLDFF